MTDRRPSVSDALKQYEGAEQEKRPPATEEAKRTRTVSDASRAATIYTKLEAIDADEKAELQASPASIMAKHHARREKALSDASESVRVLVERMRGGQ